MNRPNTSRLLNLNKNKNYLEKFQNKKDKINCKNDIWMPTNYKNYEQLVKDRKLFIQKMKQNPFFNRLPSCTLKEIQSKTCNTDIFFINSPKSNSQTKLLF